MASAETKRSDAIGLIAPDVRRAKYRLTNIMSAAHLRPNACSNRGALTSTVPNRDRNSNHQCHSYSVYQISRGRWRPELGHEWIAPDQSIHIAKAILLDLAANGHQIVKKGGI